jgi:enoyl-CoA hydratase/carnithine racemase
VADLVRTEDRGPVRHVVLNRPEKRNAFHGELVLALGAALRAAADDPEVKCVVLRGEGPVFSAGMDVGALAALGSTPERLRTFRRECLTAWNLAEEMPKPVVAQIHGACLGGAMELALACDLRVLSEDTVMGLPETRLGLVPDVGGSSRLPQVVGLGRAKELIMTGRNVGAEEALRIGLANRVAPAEGLEAATGELVDALLAGAPHAVGLAKRLLDASARPALSTTLELEVIAQELSVRRLS